MKILQKKLKFKKKTQVTKFYTFCGQILRVRSWRRILHIVRRFSWLLWRACFLVIRLFYSRPAKQNSPVKALLPMHIYVRDHTREYLENLPSICGAWKTDFGTVLKLFTVIKLVAYYRRIIATIEIILNAL